MRPASFGARRFASRFRPDLYARGLRSNGLAAFIGYACGATGVPFAARYTDPCCRGNAQPDGDNDAYGNR